MNLFPKVLVALVMNTVLVLVLSGNVASASDREGEALFKQHCVACHPNGGNIVNPKKTLSKKDLQANNAWSKEGIVKVIRNPGPGMLAFDQKTLSDKDAHEIAEYVMKAFAK